MTIALFGTATAGFLLQMPVPVTMHVNVVFAPLIRTITRKKPLDGAFWVTTLTRNLLNEPAGIRMDAACSPSPGPGKFSPNTLLIHRKGQHPTPEKNILRTENK